MRCCSIGCKKSTECGLHLSNNVSTGTHQLIDCANYGSGSISSNGITDDTWWCGELGGYKMFVPIQLTQEEFASLHCRVCGFQKCNGIESKWFSECKFKEHVFLD